MATVVALTSFVGVLENAVLDKPRIEHHSEFPGQPSVIPGKMLSAGKSIQVVRGQKYEDNHPAVKKWPEMFGKVEIHPEVEAATAAPGEKRGR